MLKNVMVLAAGALGLSLVVPVMAPQSQEPQESNIIRAEKAAPRNANITLTTETSSSKSCHISDDLGISSCPTRTKKHRPLRSSQESKKKASKKRNNSGRSYVIESDQYGHFNTVARMNGMRIPVLVDTGATSVAINKSTARRLGISLRSDDFKHKARTANGIALFARAKIRNIRIGGIVIDEVDASVLDDKSLSTTLLGMSFLKRLTKFEMSGGRFKMIQ